MINNIRQDILESLAQVEVNIDYPEYDDVETMTSQMLLEKTAHFEQLLENLLSTAKRGKILREGLKRPLLDFQTLENQAYSINYYVKKKPLSLTLLEQHVMLLPSLPILVAYLLN